MAVVVRTGPIGNVDLDEEPRRSEIRFQILRNEVCAIFDHDSNLFLLGSTPRALVVGGGDRNVPNPLKVRSVLRGKHVTEICTGGDHTLFRMENGQLFGCGNNTEHAWPGSRPTHGHE